MLDKRYKCRECGDHHEVLYMAETCCPVDVDEGYACPVCDDFHDSESDAIECCDSGEEDVPTVSELEEAGQLRLIE